MTERVVLLRVGRYGFLPEEMEKITPVYHYMDTIHVTGIYTHLHSAFCDKKATKAQIESFSRVLAALREAGIEPGMAHILNSSGVLHFSGAAMDAVRVGSALLGRVHGGHGLKRVGYCETQVEELKWLPKGHTTGYGAGWKAKRPTRVAILPVGCSSVALRCLPLMRFCGFDGDRASFVSSSSIQEVVAATFSVTTSKSEFSTSSKKELCSWA